MARPHRRAVCVFGGDFSVAHRHYPSVRTWAHTALLVASACVPERSAATASPDAQPADAYECRESYPMEFLSSELVGRTPAGSLARLDHMVTHYLAAWCGDLYVVAFLEEAAYDCSRAGRLTLQVPVPAHAPPPAPGDRLTTYVAVELDGEHAATYGDLFEVLYVDSPMAASPRFAGRFSLHDERWDFDVNVDTVSQQFIVCTGL